MEKGKEVLKHFDGIFETETLKHINFSNMKLLKVLFNYFEEDLYTPSDTYNELRAKTIKISDKLESTFTQEQQKLFEDYWEAESLMHCEENEQMFLFGYIIAKELEAETKLAKENE